MKLKVATRRRTIDPHPMLLTTKLDPFLTFFLFLLHHHLHLLLQLSGFGIVVAVAQAGPYDGAYKAMPALRCPAGYAYNAATRRCCKAYDRRCYSPDLMNCYEDGKLPCDEGV